MLIRYIFGFDLDLEVRGYDLIRADHPSNVKRGCVCIYYKNSLPLKLTNINFLHECLTIPDNTSDEESILNDLMAQYGLTQIIHEPTHILESSVSCIDLICTSQENLVINSGVHSSLHPNCHHQTFFANFNQKTHYPPPYEILIWKYEKANADLIKRAIKDFDW